MGKVKDTSFFTVQGWMLNQLHLKGNQLQVFAIIHGFSHSDGNEYAGGLQYLCEFTGASRSTVIRSLSELQERGFIDKREVYENGVKFNRYKSSVDMLVYFDTPSVKMTPPQCQNDTTPRFKMTPHNIEDNIENIKEKRKRFSPPSVEEVREYCQQRGNTIDPEAFVAFYASKGWKVGSQSMKSWKASVITWEKRMEQSAPKEEKKRRFVGTEIVDGEEVAIYE